jgi:hypothetical protein
VVRPVALVRLWHAKSELGKDAGSPRIERDTRATEDDARRCFAAAQGRAGRRRTSH